MQKYTVSYSSYSIKRVPGVQKRGRVEIWYLNTYIYIGCTRILATVAVADNNTLYVEIKMTTIQKSGVTMGVTIRLFLYLVES